MPTFEITSPDGRKFRVEGPEGSTAEQAMQQVQAQYKPQAAASAPVAPVDSRPYGTSSDAQVEPLAALGSGAIATPIAGLAGLAQGAKNLFSPGMPAADRVAQVQGALTYQPRTQMGASALDIGTKPFQWLQKGADMAGGAYAEYTGKPALGAALNTAIQAAPALLTPLRGRMGNGSGSPSPVRSPVAAGEAETSVQAAPKGGRQTGLAAVSEKPPSIEQLKSQAREAYKRADEAGITVPADSLTGLKTRLVADLKKEGVDPDLHPSTTAALNRILKSEGDLTLSEVETLRKIAGDAGKTMVPADARLAGKIVDHIDDLMETLPGDAAALKEARGLYSRMKKAEDIEALIERAKISSSGFSGSGLENALRTEFRALAKNPKKMRRFNAEEQAAIKKVATGGGKLSPENIARYVGKLAPTGGLSTYLGLGAAAVVPGGLAIPAIGGVGRIAATQMTKRNAAKAGELMRRGPKNALAETKRNALAETP